MDRIHVLHENDAWLDPLRAAFRRRGLPWTDWFLHEGVLDLGRVPPNGVFYNRMSASSHTRGHRFAPEYASAVLGWLESHGRAVVNGSGALALEISKSAQYTARAAHGVPTPHTVAAVGRGQAIEAAKTFTGALIVKPNRGGKGLGVRLFANGAAARDYLENGAFEPSVDGITLLQAYVEPPEPHITRMEFVGGRFFYAVRVDTSEGFELCPADACRSASDPRPMFEIVDGFVSPLIEPIERFLAANDIQVAGVEFIRDRAGDCYVYDVNTNTNYNPDAEAAVGLSGMDRLAEFLGHRLAADAAARKAA